MAFVSAGLALSVTLQDNGGNLTSVEYALTSADYATAETDSDTILAALAAVSDGVITAYSIRETYENDAVSFPASGVQAEVSASLTTYISGAGSKKANIRIPMPKPAMFVALSGDGANNVDLTDGAIIAYHGLFTATGEATVSDGEIAGLLLSGVRVTRKARRG